MNKLASVFRFYKDGFKNLTIGKTLWKIILIKLLIILVFLKYFIYDKNLKSEYPTKEEKISFIYKNLTKD